MTTITLQDVVVAAVPAGVEIVALDIQGAELDALRGLRDWNGINWTCMAVLARELHDRQPLVGGLDACLGPRGFGRVATVILEPYRWSDAL